MNKPPLSDLKVLDFSMFTPGPFASQILADLGATVLKVERPGVGDLERITVPGYFHGYNRGKGSLVLDLKNPDDIAYAKELAKEADIVLEGFRPGVMDRLGLGFAALAAINPRMIHVSLNGMGSWGPHAQDRGHDSEYMARIGGLGVTPRPDGAPMYDVPVPLTDYGAGFFAVIAILAALRHPEKFPVHVEAPCMAAGVALMFPRMVMETQDNLGPTAGRITPGVGCFRTKDDKWVTVTAVEDHVFLALCAVLEDTGMASDPAFATFTQRYAAAEALNDRIAGAVAKFDRDACVAAMEHAGVPCAPVNDIEDAMTDPQVLALDMLHTEPVLHADLPIWGLGRKRNIRPPILGEHTEIVRNGGWAALAEVL